MAIAVHMKKVYGRTVLQATLLDAVTATGDGEWVDVSGFHEMSVDISGITSATVALRCSNDLTRPANASSEREIQAVTSDQTVIIIFPIRWIKAAVTGYTSGTITAQLYGNAPR